MSDNKKTKVAPDDTNIFDLTALVGIQNEQEVKKKDNTITPEAREKMLQNYSELNNAEWESIPLLKHIRYLRKDGAFRMGGIVKNSFIGLYGTSKGKKCIQLASSPDYKSAKWTICLNDIEKIWQKNNDTGSSDTNLSPEIKNKIQSNNESIEYLLRTVEQNKIDISKIVNEQTRIINLIKKLHNIKSSSSSSSSSERK